MNTDLLISTTAFTVLTFLWMGFGAALVFNRGLLARAWQAFGRWNFLLKALAVLLFLPVVIGLWIWGRQWPAWLRLCIVVGLAWMTEYTFFPRFLFGS